MLSRESNPSHVKGGTGPPLLPQHLLVYDILAVGPAVEDREEVLYGDHGHAVDRLARHAGDMGGGDEVLKLQERVVGRGRLLVEDVERGAGDLVAAERVMQRLLVDDAAARGVDEKRGSLHARQPGGVEEADRLRRLRAMDRDEIGAGDRLVEIADRLVAHPPD